MTSQRGKQTIAIHILPNISRSKGNQTIKFGQFIEYNTRSLFLKNYAQNVVENVHFPFGYFISSLRTHIVSFFFCKYLIFSTECG